MKKEHIIKKGSAKKELKELIQQEHEQGEKVTMKKEKVKHHMHKAGHHMKHAAKHMKHGGKAKKEVKAEGEKAKMRLDKPMKRATGGRTLDTTDAGVSPSSPFAQGSPQRSKK